MATEPVVVIHGVANRSKTDFARVVDDLARRIDRDIVWLPVYWGDLGAQNKYIDRVLPPILDLGLEAVPAPELQEVVPGVSAGHAKGNVELVIASAQLELSGAAEGSAPIFPSGFPEAVRAAWEQTVFLRQVTDPRMLADIGRMVAGVIPPPTATEGPWVPDVLRAVRGLFSPLDDLLAAVGGRTAGAINQAIRRSVLPEVAKFLGDVFVYQRDRVAIQSRIWDLLDAQTRWPALGRSPETAVTVVAHSLGGVVAFDAAATGSQGLYIKSFVTFGSQSPFFHLIDPRDGRNSTALPPYRGGRSKVPIRLVPRPSCPAAALHRGSEQT